MTIDSKYLPSSRSIWRRLHQLFTFAMLYSFSFPSNPLHCWRQCAHFCVETLIYRRCALLRFEEVNVAAINYSSPRWKCIIYSSRHSFQTRIYTTVFSFSTGFLLLLLSLSSALGSMFEQATSTSLSIYEQPRDRYVHVRFFFVPPSVTFHYRRLSWPLLNGCPPIQCLCLNSLQV